MYRIMTITLAFQANDDGSIPFARSIVTNFTGSLYAGFFITSKNKAGWSMNKMPEKTPEFWTALLVYLQQNYNAIAGFVMAFFMSMLRGFFLQQKITFRQRLLDGSICGALTLSSMSLLVYAGVGESLSTFVGGMLGFVGAEKIREFLFSLIRKKIDVNDVGFGKQNKSDDRDEFN